MSRISPLCGVLVFVASIGTYLWTLAPTVTFVDSGELIVAARNLGVAHPPGTPLYVMLAHVAALMPAGNVAVRVHMVSALFAALSAGTIVVVLAEILATTRDVVERPVTDRGHSRRKRRHGRGTPSGPAASGVHVGGPTPVEARGISKWLWVVLPMCVSGFLLAFSRTLWSFATVAEVYSLNTWLILVVLLMVVRWRRHWQTALSTRASDRTVTSDRLLYAAAFVFGLGLGVHHVTVAVTAPALALIVWQTRGGAFFLSRRFFGIAMVGLASVCLVYSYLPLAAARLPVLNWGDPRTLERLWWHVSGKQYQAFVDVSLEQIANQAVAFAQLALVEFGPVWLPAGLVLSLVGFVSCFRRDRTIFLALCALIAVDMAYALNYDIAEDKGAYYLPTFIAAAIAAGLGARSVLSVATRWRVRSPLLPLAGIVAVLIAPVAALAGNAGPCNRRNYFLASDYIRNIDATIAPNGMLLTRDWQVYSPMLYVREIEHRRQDIVAIDINMLRRSWYVEYVARAYPVLIADARGEVDAFLGDLRAWERDPAMFASSRSLTQRIDMRFQAMILAFIRAHLRIAPVYATHDVVLAFNTPDGGLARAIGELYQLIPQGLVFELSPERSFRALIPLKLETRGLFDGSVALEAGDVVLLKVRPVYLNMLVNRGRYLASHGRHDLAVEAFRQALTLDPSFATAADDLSRSAAAIGARP